MARQKKQKLEVLDEGFIVMESPVTIKVMSKIHCFNPESNTRFIPGVKMDVEEDPWINAQLAAEVLVKCS